ncbi:hypothetical protein J2752_000430 [Halarchaeum rubridurum]|uniref:Uncharacterized protein n=1 Tax=Halarchaeum rubridurum TaxID=489911 RepID=A0A830FY15_9EURY|nr:DUF5785 family protein [Halarchaeum rubridurum]MBP1953549.1 hypothetical protein [Halarchaeum rubridurum]GGM64436.1 hypothetical protein GCM10009017_13110 [Halarchaeum rubridurum]
MEDMYDESGRDWPHDPDGEEGSEGGRKYGMAVLSKKVDEDEDFPLQKEAFVAEYGDDPVRINYRKVVSVADIFEHVEAEEYSDKVDFWKQVGQGMRDGDLWDYRPTGE